MVASYSDDDGPPDPLSPFQSSAFDPSEYDHLPTMQSWRKNGDDVWKSIKTPIIFILIAIPSLIVFRLVREELTRPRFVVPNENVELAPRPNDAVAHRIDKTVQPPRQPAVKIPAPVVPGPTDREKIEPLFSLSDAVIVAPAVPSEELFAQAEKKDGFMISIQYRINRTEKVIVSRHYTLHLTFDGETQHLPFENMNREGLFQVKIHPLREQIPAELKAWVEWNNPEQRGPEIRVSNVVSFTRTDVLPPLPPPPLDDPHAPSVVIDRAGKPVHTDDDSPDATTKDAGALTEKEIDELIRTLLVFDKWKVRTPLAQLGKTPPIPSKQQEVNRVLRELFEKSDHAVRMEIIRIWSTWGTEEVVPDLRRALEEGNDFMRSESLRTISHRRFESAIPAVIVLARTGKYRTEIQEAIISFGSSAEESVWPLLEGSSAETIKLALRILRRIGTEKSLPKIQKLLNDPDPFVRVDAENCSKDIQRRTK